MVHIPEWLNNFAHDTGAYFFCVIGVLMSHYIPEYRTQGTIDFDMPVIGELAVAAVIAFIIMFGIDHHGEASGRQRNFKKRAAYSLTMGVTWHTLLMN